MKLKKYATILFLLVSILLLGKWRVFDVLAQQSCDSTCNQDDQKCLSNLVSLCGSKVQELQGQANTLSNQIAQFNAQIRLTTLQITQTEQKITQLGGRIDQLEISLDSLTKAFTSRAVETYKVARAGNNLLFLLTSVDLTEAVSRFHYLQVVQEEDTNLLQRLQTAQVDYKNQKSSQEQLQSELQVEQANLNNQKVAKASLLAATQNSEAKYQALLAAAQSELSALSEYALGRTSLSPNQTVCDDWGCYYAQGDPAWGNMFLGNSKYTVAGSGCLVTSSAMIATHYKKNLTPADVSQTPSAWWLSKDITVNGVRIVRTSFAVASTSNIDSELSQGRPVIVGLFSACGDSGCFPKHFIVLKSGSSGNYVMDDPLGKDNGYNKPFTDQYNLSDITDVERVDVY